MKKALTHIVGSFFFIIYVIGIITLLIYFDVILMLNTIFRYSKSVKKLDERLHAHAHILLNFVDLFMGTHFVPINLSKIRDSVQSLPMIVLSNHQSFIDILMLSYVLHYHPVRFVVKHSLKKGFPYVSSIIKSQRHAAIKRDNPIQSVAEIEKIAKYAYRDNNLIVLFPEGTRSKTGKVLPFHSAAIRTIMKKGLIPIAVVALHNSYKVSSLLHFRPFPSKYYYAKLLHVYHPKSRSEVKTIVQEAHDKIEAQIIRWDKRERVSR